MFVVWPPQSPTQVRSNNEHRYIGPKLYWVRFQLPQHRLPYVRDWKSDTQRHGFDASLAVPAAHNIYRLKYMLMKQKKQNIETIYEITIRSNVCCRFTRSMFSVWSSMEDTVCMGAYCCPIYVNMRTLSTTAIYIPFLLSADVCLVYIGNDIIVCQQSIRRTVWAMSNRLRVRFVNAFARFLLQASGMISDVFESIIIEFSIHFCSSYN